MTRALRILHLEDDPNDAELVAIHLRAEHFPCHIVHVKSEKEFAAALDGERFDVIFADNAGPGFNGRSAFEIARRKQPETPLLILSGVDASKSQNAAHAAGVVLKDRLSDLIPTLRRIVPLTDHAS